MVSFEKITDLIGYLVLTEDGAVLESGGELKNDERRANIIMSLLHLTDSVDVKQFDRSDCQKVSIVYDDFSYIICMSNRKIYIVKRLNRAQRRSNSLQTPETSLSAPGQSAEAAGGTGEQQLTVSHAGGSGIEASGGSSELA